MTAYNRQSMLDTNELFSKSKWGRRNKKRKTIDLFGEYLSMQSNT